MAPLTTSPPSNVNVVWTPQPGSQTAFLTVPPAIFEVLYHGNRGGGKTDCLIMDFAQHCGVGFGRAWRGLIFRRTYPELQDVISKSEEWFSQVFPQAKYNRGKTFWEWPDGERLYFRHFLREEDYNKYHGHAYPFMGWEELTTWPNDGGYKRMMSLCRSTKPGMPRKYRGTTNPYGVGHNWVKQRFHLEGRVPPGPGPIIDITDDDGNFLHKAVAIASSVKENKILLEADPGYIDKIRASARNEAELAAWLYNDWSVVAGGMFDDVWDPATHIIPAFRVPPTWRLDRSFDWGSSRPFSVGWWAESDGSDLRLRDGTVMATVPGDLFRINEWYGWTGKSNEGLKLLASEIAEGIVQRELEMGLYGRIKPGPADSAIFTVENGHSIANDFGMPVRLNDKQYGGVFWGYADKSPGSRKAGWQAIRERLMNAKAETRDGRSIPREKPGLFVTDLCKDGFIRTVPTLPRKKTDPDDVDTDAEDHVGDETRYRVRNGVKNGGSGMGQVTGMF